MKRFFEELNNYEHIFRAKITCCPRQFFFNAVKPHCSTLAKKDTVTHTIFCFEK